VKILVTAFASGLLFAVGLVIGGMTDPQKVQGFLDIAGNWDPSLIFVMGGAVGTHGILRLLINRRSKPVFAPLFPTRPNTRLDLRLLAGAALFGAGWGLSGYCPGPALTSVVTGGTTTVVFVLSMLGGMLVFQVWDGVRAPRAAAAPAPEPLSE